MDNDDFPIGRILSRREVLALMGTTGAFVLTACATGQASGGTDVLACVVSPEMTEGPYYLDVNLNRSDIRTDSATGETKEGATLTLLLSVSQVGGTGCTPLSGATVEIWHCDALGQYSGVSDPGFDTRAQNWLRGYQVTDAGGSVQFTTIYPGWYQGRAVHIHFKVTATGTDGEIYEFTSQLFFDEALTDTVHAQEPYAGKGYRTVLNDQDGIYADGGDQLMITAAASADGYAGSYDVGLYTEPG